MVSTALICAGVFAKAHGPEFSNPKPEAFMTDIELVAELAVAVGNRCGALPVTLLVVVFSAILH